MTELEQAGFVVKEEKVIVDKLVPEFIMLDDESGEYVISKSLTELVEFLESLTISRLKKVLNYLSQRMKNLVLDSFIDTEES